MKINRAVCTGGSLQNDADEVEHYCTSMDMQKLTTCVVTGNN